MLNPLLFYFKVINNFNFITKYNFKNGITTLKPKSNMNKNLNPIILCENLKLFSTLKP
jgi:hypothetical protein